MSRLGTELRENLPEPEFNYSENGTEGDPYFVEAVQDYFKDKPERGYKQIGWDAIIEGRDDWPVEMFLFEVDGQLYAINGESDSWEGGWPMWDRNSIRPVEKVTHLVEKVAYEDVKENV